MRREFVISVLLVSMIIYAGYTLDTTSSKQVSVDICHEAPITEDFRFYESFISQDCRY